MEEDEESLRMEEKLSKEVFVPVQAE